jgi:hypothetical protein
LRRPRGSTRRIFIAGCFFLGPWLSVWLNRRVTVPANAVAVREEDLRHWNLLVAFRGALESSHVLAAQERSWADPGRRCQYADYLSLFLFGLFNPVVQTMQGLCAATKLPRVQREVSGGAVSPGSFSEAQHLVDPAWLEQVFGELVAQLPAPPAKEGGPTGPAWLARDSSLFAALPRMNWALYGGGRAGAANHAVRLHLSFHLVKDTPAQAQITVGKRCERQVWRESLEAGAAYVGDCYFAGSYRLLGELTERQCRYVLRLRDNAVIQVAEELPVSAVDQAAGVQRQAWVQLGSRRDQGSGRVRVVWLGTASGEPLQLVTNVAPEELSAAEVGLLYRQRWQIECFFRWVKCLLGCRHWLAESPRGVAIQLYLALIAAVLLQLYTGRRPNRRMMELLRFHQMGWATMDELIAGLEREQQREEQRKAKKTK